MTNFRLTTCTAFRRTKCDDGTVNEPRPVIIPTTPGGRHLLCWNKKAVQEVLGPLCLAGGGEALVQLSQDYKPEWVDCLRFVELPTDTAETIMQLLDARTQAPRVWPGYDSTGDAYSDAQCNDAIRDGDVLVCEPERAVAVLVAAWPVARTRVRGSFHSLTARSLASEDGRPDYSAVSYRGVGYSESFRLAEDAARRLGFELA